MEPNRNNTEPNSAIVKGANSAIVINGTTYHSGQTIDCASSPNSYSMHGALPEIVAIEKYISLLAVKHVSYSTHQTRIPLWCPPNRRNANAILCD
jgi:hypothetical protein